jgi:thymidylate synthase (FAD)
VTTVTMTSTISVEAINIAASDAMVAMAARVSTKGAGAASNAADAGLINALVRDRHGSPFEHTFFTFRVQAPLFVMTEHLRHRTGWSYNGESGRYKTFAPVFYTPPPERGVTQVGKAMEYDIQAGTRLQREEVNYALQTAAESAWSRYDSMLEAGVAREVARMVLPTSLMTTYYTSCNARSLMHFLGLRGHGTHALAEIQQVANRYEEFFADAMPDTYRAFVAAGRVAP